MNRILTIVGASARAAAQSAVAAGFCVRAADLFADADLVRLGDAVRVERYPQDLATVVAGPQEGPWLYTGALENYPALVDALATQRPLWGNPGRVLRRVRNPRRLAETLAAAGLNTPWVAADPRFLAEGDTWLRKPRRSAGGTRITRWTARGHSEPGGPAHYFQQYIEGAAYSAVYIAANGHARLLGVTRQLVGCAWAGAAGFQYCGSVGPAVLPETAVQEFAAVGETLASQFGLVGLFGVDALVNPSGVWPVEVNPRYTASVEVLERALEVLAIEWHAAACERGELPPRRQSAGTVHGKAILFAPARLQINAAWTDRTLTNLARPPALADIPNAGTIVEAGNPIITLFADGTIERDVVATLKRRAEEILAELVPRTV